MPRARIQRGLALRCYLAASHLIPLLAPTLVRRRLKRGKEHPERWREKLGQDLPPRPEGTVVWMHAVGLGEVLSLRGLITAMAALRTDVSFVVTSTTVSAARAFARNAPPRTQHQFLPLDAPGYRRRFLDHLRPDLCIWAEQDLWPGLVSDLAARDIPQCVVAARMNARSYASHDKARGLFANLYRVMALITAQDASSAAHLTALGAVAEVTGSLKPAAPPLTCAPDELARLQERIAGRFVWTVAPAHPADITIAQAAHAILRKTQPDALLIIAPRFPETQADLPGPRRSLGEVPGDADPIWIFDTFGELGLVYRLAQAALIGGTFSAIEGHNPWEAAALSTAILHGPSTANFAGDFERLAEKNAAVAVEDADAVAQALQEADLPGLAERAAACAGTARAETEKLAARLVGMLEA